MYLSELEFAFIEAFQHRWPLQRLGRPPQNHRRKLEGLCWLAETGRTWRELPAQFGSWGSVHRQYVRWSEKGLWDRLLKVLDESPLSERNRAMFLWNGLDPDAVRAEPHLKAKLEKLRTLWDRRE